MNFNTSNARQITALLTAGAALCSLLALTGCGSGGGTTTALPVPSPSATPIDSLVITRATENTLTDDAKILATREATGAFVPLDAARAFDADLAKIRAAYPGVQEVHARPEAIPTNIIVSVKNASPWLAKWQASADAPKATVDTDLTTGEAALDALLKKYDTTRAVSAYKVDTEVIFLIQFAQSLNTVPVAREFAEASANIKYADVNGLIGDGDNIVYSVNSNGEKVYAFSQGYGDCPAGCISHYTRTYTIHSDGTITEQTEGTPPTNGNAITPL